MKNFWFIAALLFAPYAAAQVSKATVLICTPISSVDVSDSGEAVVSKEPKYGGATGGWRQKILIDLESGIVRQPPSGEAQSYWRIVQKGDSANDWVLMPFFDEKASLKSNLARLSTEIFRVRNWDKSKPVIFFRVFLASSISGTCVPIK